MVPSALYPVVYTALKVITCACIIAIPRRKNPLQYRDNLAKPLPWRWWQFLWQQNHLCLAFPPTSFLLSLHALALKLTAGKLPIVPKKISLSLCFGGHTELIFVLFPDLLPCSLNAHLTGTAQTPGDAQALRVAAKIKGLSPTVKLHLPWLGRLLVSRVLGLLAQVRKISFILSCGTNE